MSPRVLLAVLVATALVALLPARSPAVDFNIAGSIQLDYHWLPATDRDPRPPTHTFAGFTEEAGIKLAVDFNQHLSANVKVCWGCHGFELAMGFVDFRLNDAFNLRVGRFNPTFGEFQLRQDVGNHRTSDRPLPYDMGRMLYMFDFNRSVLPIPYVETGAEISGTINIGRRVQIDYAGHVVAGLRSLSESPYDVDFIASRTPYYVDNNAQPSVGGRLGVSLRLADRVDLSFGASALHGTYDTNRLRTYTVLGADLQFRVNRTIVRGEYLIRRTEMAAGSQTRFEYEVPRMADGRFQEELFMVKDGWYLEVEQPITRNVEVLLRWDGLRRFGNTEPGSGVDNSAGISRWTAGVNFILARGYRLKTSVEYWQLWGVRAARGDAVSFHLSAVATF